MGAIRSAMRSCHIQNGFSLEERADLDAPELWPEVDGLSCFFAGIAELAVSAGRKNQFPPTGPIK